MAESVVVTCCAASDKDMARKNGGHGEQEMSETQQDLRRGGAHSIDRMVERKKTSERDSVMERFDVDQNKQRLFVLHRWAGCIARSGTNTQTAMALRTRGLQWWREARLKHSSKWERSTPRGVSLVGDGKRRSRSSKEYKGRGVSRCNEKRGMAGRSTGQKTMEEKKVKLSSRTRKTHAEAQSTNHKKERICS